MHFLYMTNELRIIRACFSRMFVLEALDLARAAVSKISVPLVVLGRVTKAWQVVSNRL